MVDFLAKPVSPDLLRQTIERLAVRPVGRDHGRRCLTTGMGTIGPAGLGAGAAWSEHQPNGWVASGGTGEPPAR